MKKAIVCAMVASTLISGCATRKVPVTPGAEKVSAIKDTSNLNCKLVGTHTIMKAHPNNISRELKNAAYAKGGNRYKVVNILSGKAPKPTGVVAELYQCNFQTVKPSSPPATTIDPGLITVIPGAETVQPLSFAEVENNKCKVVGSKRIELLPAEELKKELANQSYMMGGNRYHVTHITPASEEQSGSVNADVYRCKHQSMSFNG